MRRRRRKRRRGPRRVPLVPATPPNERWSMDFMGDSLADGRTFRTFNLVDDCSREAPAIEVDSRCPASGCACSTPSSPSAGAPEMIVMDNGPEFIGKALDHWAYRRGVKLHFIARQAWRTPASRASTASFATSALNEHWFVGLAQAREVIEAWRQDYNEIRPHSSLEHLPPGNSRRARTGLRSPSAPYGPPGEDANNPELSPDWTRRGGQVRFA